MKKTLLSIIYFLGCIFSLQAQALYGAVITGGNINGGTIIKFVPATNILTVANSFESFVDGVGPAGTLLQASNGKLYGMTHSGGSNKAGVIYSYDPAASTYTKLMDFDGVNGGNPYGTLIQASDGKLYGRTNEVEFGDYGVIFSFDPSTSTYTKLKDFDSTNGYFASGSLVQASDGKLYGMTNGARSESVGAIFSFDLSSSTYTKLKDFDNTNGAVPLGSLIQASDGKLYGMTERGGTNNAGVIFSFDPSVSTYIKLKDFDGTNGSTPVGSLVQASDGKLYGMTVNGGSSDVGVIFSFDPSASTYTKLKDFDNTNGAFPLGSLMQASDGKLYGMAANGGSNLAGVIFSFDPSASVYTKLQDFNVTNGADPSFGSAFIEVKECCNGAYCSASGVCSNKGFIKNVYACYSFNNTTACTGYGDYNAKGVNTAAGKLLGFSVTPGYNSSTYQPLVYIRVWIDWNGDGDFTDGGELVFAPFNPVNVKTKFWIRVPMGTSAGRKRMRVAVSADKNIFSCDNIANGEVEDYSINVLAARSATLAVPDAGPDDFDETGETFTIYPNPVKHKMIIERSGYDEGKANNAPALMVLTNASGKTLMQSRLVNLVQAIDVSRLPSGVYFVTIINGNNKTTNKIIINR